jgi:uncharacterized protein
MSFLTTSFTPWASLFGGALIGLSAVLVMLFFGRIAGISGIALQVVRPFAARDPGDWGWRVAFLLGLVAAPLVVGSATGAPIEQTVSDNLPVMALAGLLVGFGTGLGSGCTSGHGVCGLARLSYRSLVSVLTFMAVAVATVFVLRHLVGGGS